MALSTWGSFCAAGDMVGEGRIRWSPQRADGLGGPQVARRCREYGPRSHGYSRGDGTQAGATTPPACPTPSRGSAASCSCPVRFSYVMSREFMVKQHLLYGKEFPAYLQTAFTLHPGIQAQEQTPHGK